jgi:hypothetical protein
MHRAIQYLGLCATCGKSAHCTYPRDPDRPIRHCEEFQEETEAMMAAARARTEARRGAPRQLPDNEDRSGKFLGLCRNCDNRFHCTFPRSPGGVWHCEEYK